MKSYFILSLVVLLSAFSSGCLITGQITITQGFEITATTDTNVNKYDVDLTDNQDWQDNKDKVVSIDAVAIVAWIFNREAANIGEVYWSDDPNLTTVAAVRNNATRIMVTPTINPSPPLNQINWQDGLAAMENTDSLIEQVLGDGVFTVYGIAQEVPFDMDIDGEIVLTVTIEE